MIALVALLKAGTIILVTFRFLAGAAYFWWSSNPWFGVIAGD